MSCVSGHHSVLFGFVLFSCVVICLLGPPAKLTMFLSRQWFISGCTSPNKKDLWRVQLRADRYVSVSQPIHHTGAHVHIQMENGFAPLRKGSGHLHGKGNVLITFLVAATKCLTKSTQGWKCSFGSQLEGVVAGRQSVGQTATSPPQRAGCWCSICLFLRPWPMGGHCPHSGWTFRSLETPSQTYPEVWPLNDSKPQPSRYQRLTGHHRTSQEMRAGSIHEINTVNRG